MASLPLNRLSAAMRAAGPEWTRRVALARETHPDGIEAPRLRYLLAEFFYIFEPARRMVRQARNPFHLAAAPTPRTVMILPGFASHPLQMRYFAQALEEAGHRVKRWGLGKNWGPNSDSFERLERRLLDLAERHGEPIYLLGWSLGGLFARELAHRHPQAVAKVITMGTPFSYSPRANNLWRVYQFITGHRVEKPPIAIRHLSEKPPVPTVAIWSPRDGAIHPRAACGKPHERDRAVALRCSHMGFSYAPEAIGAVAAEL